MLQVLKQVRTFRSNVALVFIGSLANEVIASQLRDGARFMLLSEPLPNGSLFGCPGRILGARSRS